MQRATKRKTGIKRQKWGWGKTGKWVKKRGHLGVKRRKLRRKIPERITEKKKRLMPIKRFFDLLHPEMEKDMKWRVRSYYVTAKAGKPSHVNTKIIIDAANRIFLKKNASFQQIAKEMNAEAGKQIISGTWLSNFNAEARIRSKEEIKKFHSPLKVKHRLMDDKKFFKLCALPEEKKKMLYALYSERARKQPLRVSPAIKFIVAANKLHTTNKSWGAITEEMTESGLKVSQSFLAKINEAVEIRPVKRRSRQEVVTETTETLSAKIAPMVEQGYSIKKVFKVFSLTETDASRNRIRTIYQKIKYGRKRTK